MTDDIQSWLEDHGLEQYAAKFSEHDVDMDVLPDLTDEDLVELGISLGHRRRLKKAIESFQDQNSESEDGERRQLTVLFCDLADSTRLSVQFDPEDFRKIILAYQQCCERAVHEFHGYVARYMGDGLLVYFGYPTAFEDGPERAVRAGLELIAAVRRLEPQRGVRLQTRVGIATGNVVVGDLIGGKLTSERQVVGRTPNLAARLQAKAEPDTVVISEATKRLVGGLFDYIDLGLHTPKGFDIPISSWQVGQELTIESRFDATHSDAELTRLVGRDEEIRQLRSCWETASAGNGLAVLVTGEAGIGKSRLLHELRKQLERAPHFLRRYFCVSYYQNSALFPLISHLERASGFLPGDSAEMKLSKLETLLSKSAENALDTAPLVASLLSIPAADRYPAQNLSAQRQKEMTLEAFENQMGYLAKQKPVLVVFEDLHWADPTTVELLQRLTRKAMEIPLLLLMTARPDFRPPWLDDGMVTVLDLDRLGAQQEAALISQVTADKSLPAEIYDQIIEKAAGVPLWITELTKNVLESGVVEESDDGYVLTGVSPTVAIPKTLQDSLMARLDKLSTAKKVAQVGATIGRDFSYRLLSEVASLDRARLNKALEQLTDAELLSRDGKPPDAIYTFRHALIQDSAYSGLLRDKRQDLHAQTATALKRQFPETVDTRPELLAHHYTRAGQPFEAIPYWQQAGGNAADRAAHTEAIRHLETAIGLLADLPEDRERDQLELGLRAALGLNLEATLGYAAPDVRKCYHRAHELCRELGETFELVPLLLGLYVFHLVRSELTIAREFAEQCVRLSQEAKNVEYLVESYAALGFAIFYQGEIDQSRGPLQECVSLGEKRDMALNRPITAQDPVVASLSLLAFAEFLLGNADTSLKRLSQAFELADNLARPINEALVYAHAAELYQLRREPEEALRHAQKGQAVSAVNGYDIWKLANTMHLGIADAVLGNQDGLSCCEQALSYWRAAGAEQTVSYFLSGIAQANHLAGHADKALKTISEALDQTDRVHEYCHVPMLHQLAGTFHLDLAEPDYEAAETSFVAAIEKAREQEARQIELRATNCLYRLHRHQGRGSETESQLRQLLASFDEGHDTLDLQEAKLLLGEGKPSSQS